MTLSSGVHLGSYEILAPLGAGGMGEVYRARDTKLGREVAVKVLPEDFAQSEDRLARFEREARVLASLNHPHVATLHGFEQEGETRFLVMELVEGEDLATRLKRGPFSLREALPLFVQVAEGLEGAHEHGIIHRDLKPANIKVTEDGTAKILDFGLAKAIQPTAEIASGDLSQSPTLSATHHGEILGTAAYMSPEQAQGKAVDKRTDIWAFGCCLYETLTGDRAFSGDTAPQTLAKILERDPKWETLPEATPARIRELLRRCLEKDPKQRLHDIADARLEIASALEAPTEVLPIPGRASSRTRWRWTVVAGLIGLSAGLLLAGLAPSLSRQAAPARPTRATIRLPSDAPIALLPFHQAQVALSRDGSKLAYAASQAGTTHLYLRSLDSPAVRPIPGTEQGRLPAFSPDGSELAFVTHDYLKTVSLQGGEPKIVCEGRTVNGVTWAEDGRIYFTRHEWELVGVPEDGGKAEAVVYLVTNPVALPNGSGILVTDWKGATSARADFLSVAHVSPDGRFTTILEGGYHGHYSATGHLLFMRGGQLHAAPFSLDRLEVTGPSAPVLDGVWTDSNYGTAQFDVSDNGTLAFVEGGDVSRTIPTWISRTGEEEPLALPAHVYRSFSLSANGQRLALHVSGPTDQIHVYDMERRTSRRLTLTGSNGYPNWTADSDTVIFWRWSLARTNDSHGRVDWQSEISWQPVDGSREAARLLAEENLTETPGGCLIPGAVSPDGSLLVVFHEHPTRRGDVWLVPLDGQGDPRPLAVTDDHESYVSFSPDGRWVAFVTNKTGRDEVFVRSFPEGEAEWQVSNGGGYGLQWSPRGDEIFYRDQQRLMAVPVSTEPRFQAGTPYVVFERDDFTDLPGGSFAVSPDDERILIGKRVSSVQPVAELQVVVNWFEELKEKMREADQ